MIAEVLVVAIDLWDLLTGLVIFALISHVLKRRRAKLA